MSRKTVVKSIQDSRQLLKALGNLSDTTKDVEEHFTDELHLFFQYLGRKVLANVDLDQPLNAIFYQQVEDVIGKYWEEYEEILSTYVDKGYQIGIVHSKVLLSASKDHAKQYESLKSQDKELFFKPNAKVSKRLKTYKFEASESIKNRVTEEINQTLGEAYREGWGRENVTKHIQQKFTDLSTWEARRIAVTEVNSARNIAHYNQLITDNINYQKWVPSKDNKVRASHKDHKEGGVGGEIVPVGERFSNGLLHPGDKNGGPIKEWVNCRCTGVAFIMPLGYRAPDFYPFFEEDLIKIDAQPKDVGEVLGNVPNWSYQYKGKIFTFQGNTSMGRVDFLMKYGLNVNKLEKEEELFLRIFTRNSSAINDYLRKGKKDLKLYAKKWEDINTQLIDAGIISERLQFGKALSIYDSIFEKYSVPLQEDIIVCRRERNRHMGLNGETEYTDKAFTSTSIYEYAKEDEYGNEINYILIPKGEKILYLEEITSSPGDYEVLIKPNIHLEHIENLSPNKKIWEL